MRASRPLAVDFVGFRVSRDKLVGFRVLRPQGSGALGSAFFCSLVCFDLSLFCCRGLLEAYGREAGSALKHLVGDTPHLSTPCAVVEVGGGGGGAVAVVLLV